jgi:hypothetical protein
MTTRHDVIRKSDLMTNSQVRIFLCFQSLYRRWDITKDFGLVFEKYEVWMSSGPYLSPLLAFLKFRS